MNLLTVSAILVLAIAQCTPALGGARPRRAFGILGGLQQAIDGERNLATGLTQGVTSGVQGVIDAKRDFATDIRKTFTGEHGVGEGLPQPPEYYNRGVF